MVVIVPEGSVNAEPFSFIPIEKDRRPKKIIIFVD